MNQQQDPWKKFLTTLANIDTAAPRLITTIIQIGAAIDVLVIVVEHVHKAIV